MCAARGAELSGANLLDAFLRSATLTGFVWNATTCPDGMLSDQGAARGTCCKLSTGTPGRFMPGFGEPSSQPVA